VLGQPTFVHALSAPSLQVQVLQPSRSGTPVKPFGYTTLPTLHAAFAGSSLNGASSQRPASLQVPGRGGTHGAHNASPHALLACSLSAESSLMASVLTASTGVEQPQGSVAAAVAWQWIE
jgi:hypothetical protein